MAGLAPTEGDLLYADGEISVVPQELEAGQASSATGTDFDGLDDGDGGATASLAQKDCRQVRNIHEIIVNLPWPEPDDNIGKVTLRSWFCWNENTKNARWSSEHDLLEVDNGVTDWAKKIGYELTTIGDKIKFSEPWGGGSQGQTHMERKIRVRWCIPTKGYCPVDFERQLITLGRYTGAAIDDSIGFGDD
jgi:hypothetical protein